MRHVHPKKNKMCEQNVLDAILTLRQRREKPSQNVLDGSLGCSFTNLSRREESQRKCVGWFCGGFEENVLDGFLCNDYMHL